MTPRKTLVILLLLAAAACGRSGKMERDQKQYDVVHEGDANSSVTSTLNAPGETTPPVTSSTITGTNVDTTTAFTVPGTATSTTDTQQPGSIAATFPDSTTGFPSGYTPRPRPQRPRVAPVTTTTNPPMN